MHDQVRRQLRDLDMGDPKPKKERKGKVVPRRKAHTTANMVIDSDEDGDGEILDFVKRERAGGFSSD